MSTPYPLRGQGEGSGTPGARSAMFGRYDQLTGCNMASRRFDQDPTMRRCHFTIRSNDPLVRVDATRTQMTGAIVPAIVGKEVYLVLDTVTFRHTSPPNVSEANGNTMVFRINGTNYTFTFPDGLYSLNSLNDKLETFLINEDFDPSIIRFGGNDTEEKIYFDITPTAYSGQVEILFENAAFNMHDLLGTTGMDNTVVTVGTRRRVEAVNQANFNRF